MKDLKDIVANIEEAKHDIIFQEVQGDSNRDAAYSTFDLVKAKRSYQHGFMSYSQYQESVFVVAFNDIEALQDLLDTDDDDYSKLLNMKPQEYKTVRGELFIKLW